VVEVYKILTAAGRPLTVREIAEQVPRVGFASTAMRLYREWHDEHDPNMSALLANIGDNWPKETIQAAIEWWVYYRVIRSPGTNSYRKNFKSGFRTAHHGAYADSTWAPDSPPSVRVVTYREAATTVDWTPELETALARGHTAGMEFLAGLTEYRTKSKHTAAEVRALLDLAERAIRARDLAK
jgi:hypothetical protein